MVVDEHKSSPFDTIRQVNERGEDYWSARDLHKILGYSEWRNFNNVVIKRAMIACKENGEGASDHFVRSYKVVTLGSGSKRKTEDIFLTRYAAYLVVMNGDPSMPVVALGRRILPPRRADRSWPTTKHLQVCQKTKNGW